MIIIKLRIVTDIDNAPLAQALRGARVPEGIDGGAGELSCAEGTDGYDISVKKMVSAPADGAVLLITDKYAGATVILGGDSGSCGKAGCCGGAGNYENKENEIGETAISAENADNKKIAPDKNTVCGEKSGLRPRKNGR